MADGDYERRGPREAELKRLRRIIEAAKALAFPDLWEIPAHYKRSPNPGVVFICV